MTGEINNKFQPVLQVRNSSDTGLEVLEDIKKKLTLPECIGF